VQWAIPFPPIGYPAQSQGSQSGSRGDDDADEDAQAQAQDEPKICPDPSPENINGRDPDAILYQSQISGLPPGLIVELNGIEFDGCDPITGMMKEAKKGEDWFFESVPEKDRAKLKEYRDIIRQDRSQSVAAGKPRVMWYFTNFDASLYWLGRFRYEGIENIDTMWEPLRRSKIERVFAAHGRRSWAGA